MSRRGWGIVECASDDPGLSTRWSSSSSLTLALSSLVSVFLMLGVFLPGEYPDLKALLQRSKVET